MKYRSLIGMMIMSGSLCLQAGEWKSWRGDTHGSGVAAEAETVRSFSEEQNLLWKVHLPGPGNSTPIITNDQLLVTCGIGGNDAVVSYDLEGKELWRTSFGSETPGKGDNKQKGTGANSSIVTDGRGIFAYFKSGRVAALTMKGKKVCRAHGGCSTGPRTKQGRKRCAEARYLHGRETRKKRELRAQKFLEMKTLFSLIED